MNSNYTRKIVHRFVEMCESRGYKEIEVVPQVDGGPVIINAVDPSNTDASAPQQKE